MNRSLSARAAPATLAGFVAWTACACAPAAWPGDTYDPQACAEDALHHHPDPELAREAAAQAASLCQAGDIAGCSMLGVVHELGLGGVRPNAARARTLYRFACEARNRRACGNLGELLLAGLGPGDPPEGAIALLRAGCEAGHARPCGVLGRWFAGAAVVPRAPAAAVWWSERACARGDAPSCVRLVDLGAAPARRSALLTMACVRGDDEGCARLAPPSSIRASSIRAERR